MKRTVQFLPQQRSVQVPAGTPLLEAANMAGLLIEAECGGRGTCGSCLMEIKPTSAPDSQTQLVNGCQVRVEEDLDVTPLSNGLIPERRRIVTGTSYILQQSTALEPNELCPLCRRLTVEVPEPSIHLSMSDRERLERVVCKAAGVDSLTMDLGVMRQLPTVLRAENGSVTVTLWQEGGHGEIIDLASGQATGRHLGVACDLGTSTVVVKLLDLQNGKTVAVASDYNRQIRSGADVISRIDVASRKGGLEKLREQVVTTINVLLRRVCQQVDVSQQTIQAVALSGNTTMVHLLVGVPPRYIREDPYVPAFGELPSLMAANLDLDVHPRARLACLPAVGSFVGGDIVSGVLTQRRFSSDGEVFLFIDVGTNGEIVLGSDDWMLCCACSAGPAFEGTGVSCGMRATTGAIERIQLSDDGDVQSLDVIGGRKPRGLCGSALIQLLGELLRTELMDRRGRLRSDPKHPRITRIGRVLGYVVQRGKETRSGREITLTENDIDNLIRAKGAIYSGCSLLLAKVGLSFNDLDAVYIAGGFGKYIALEQAIAVGMLPDLPSEHFAFLGNSSLSGACLALLSNKQKQLGNEIARSMTYVELSAEPGYMEEYTGALFLPHTELDRFPGSG